MVTRGLSPSARAVTIRNENSPYVHRLGCLVHTLPLVICQASDDIGSTVSPRCVRRQCSQNRRQHSLFSQASMLLARTLTCWQKWQYLRGQDPVSLSDVQRLEQLCPALAVASHERDSCTIWIRIDGHLEGSYLLWLAFVAVDGPSPSTTSSTSASRLPATDLRRGVPGAAARALTSPIEVLALRDVPTRGEGTAFFNFLSAGCASRSLNTAGFIVRLRSTKDMSRALITSRRVSLHGVALQEVRRERQPAQDDSAPQIHARQREIGAFRPGTPASSRKGPQAGVGGAQPPGLQKRGQSYS